MLAIAPETWYTWRMSTRIAAIGNRDFPHEYFVRDCICSLGEIDNTITIVSGGAQGPDFWAVDEAKLINIKHKEFLPDWMKYGNVAGFIRNETIVTSSDIILAFIIGNSSHTNGTLNSLNHALRQNKTVLTFKDDYKPHKLFSWGSHPLFIELVKNIANRSYT